MIDTTVKSTYESSIHVECTVFCIHSAGIAGNCHLKSQILPNFATTLENLPHFAV